MPQRGGREGNIEVIALDQHPVECFHPRGAEDFDDDKWPMSFNGSPTAFYHGILVSLDVDLHQLNRLRPERLRPTVECLGDDRRSAVFAHLLRVFELEGRAGRDEALVIDRFKKRKAAVRARQRERLDGNASGEIGIMRYIGAQQFSYALQWLEGTNA